jgi:hypothetical protein
MRESLRRDLSLSANSVSQVRIITGFRFIPVRLTAAVPPAPLRWSGSGARVSLVQQRLRCRGRHFRTSFSPPSIITGFIVLSVSLRSVSSSFRPCLLRLRCPSRVYHPHLVHSPTTPPKEPKSCVKNNPPTPPAPASSPSPTSAAAAATRALTPRSCSRAGAARKHLRVHFITGFWFRCRLVQHELRNCKFFAGFIGDSYGDCMLQYVLSLILHTQSVTFCACTAASARWTWSLATSSTTPTSGTLARGCKYPISQH